MQHGDRGCVAAAGQWIPYRNPCLSMMAYRAPVVAPSQKVWTYMIWGPKLASGAFHLFQALLGPGTNGTFLGQKYDPNPSTIYYLVWDANSDCTMLIIAEDNDDAAIWDLSYQSIDRSIDPSIHPSINPFISHQFISGIVHKPSHTDIER